MDNTSPTGKKMAASQAGQRTDTSETRLVLDWDAGRAGGYEWWDKCFVPIAAIHEQGDSVDAPNAV